MMRIIDLTRTINNEMDGVSIAPAKRLEVDGWNATTLSLYSHCGTHMDAPCHFLAEGTTLEKQVLDVCVGPASVIDLTPVQPRELLTVQQFERCDAFVKPGSRLLLRTDWHRRYGSHSYRHELPRISKELATWFVERQVALIGVEPPSVADVNDIEEVTEVHTILFEGGIVIVEGLVNLDQVRSSTVEFIAFPLKIQTGDGSPVRAIAREPDEDE